MSSPAYLAVCCLAKDVPSNIISLGRDILTNGSVVSAVSIIFSILTLLGLGLITVQWYLRWQRDETVIHLRSTSAKWIVISSVLMTFSILLRSTVWLAGYVPQSGGPSISGTNVFCIISNITVEYFSHCVCFSYIVYSLEVYHGLRNFNQNKHLEALVRWFIPAGVCSLEAWIVYNPNIVKHCYVEELDGRIAAYFTSLVPVLLALVLCPVLLYKAARSVMRLLPGQCGRFTPHERQIVSRVKLRFTLIILTFIACFLPKIIGSVMVTAGDKSMRNPLHVLWTLMGVLSSVHCLLAILVIYGWPWPCLMPWQRREGYSNIGSQSNMEINRDNTQSRSCNIGSGSESDHLLTHSY